MIKLCVLRSGGDFKPEHVIRLSKQVKDLVCLSDVDIEGIKTIPLQYDWPKWRSKLEIMRPDISGDVMQYAGMANLDRGNVDFEANIRLDNETQRRTYLRHGRQSMLG